MTRETTEDLEVRLAALARRHRLPGERLREALSSRPCDTPSCGRPASLFPGGLWCVECRAVVPVPVLPPASPPGPPRVYGTATTDPLGRDGPGWHVSVQSRLPVRDGGS